MHQHAMRKAACPEWIKFQEFICGRDHELIAYKKRKAGVLLTGDMVEVLFIPWGKGSNGKTQSLKPIRRSLAITAMQPTRASFSHEKIEAGRRLRLSRSKASAQSS